MLRASPSTVFAVLSLVSACDASPPAAQAQGGNTLVIRNATVLDTRAGRTRANTMVVVRGDRIARVESDARARSLRGAVEIDARGRLLTPGLIDVHHHSDYVFPDSITPGGGAVARLVMRPDSIARYRARWTRAFLPFGVTVVREVGGNEAHLPLMRAWMRPTPSAPDFWPSGGALVSHEEGRVPFVGHAVVRDSLDAAARVRRFHGAGLRDVKLYWRLRESDYAAAFAEARRLGMAVTSHVDFKVMSIRRALALGVRHFEHAYTLGVEVMTPEETRAAWQRTRETLGERLPAAFYWGVLEHFNAIGPDDRRMAALIAELSRSRVTVTPTLHIFAQRVGVAPHVTRALGAFDSSDAWTPAQRERAKAGYEILAGYVRRLYEAGVPLAVGSDWLEPGQAVLSEITLLHRAGVPMAAALGIATLGGAQVMEREADYGTIEPGKKAHLVLFEEDPLRDPQALFKAKTVVKGGVVVRLDR